MLRLPIDPYLPEVLRSLDQVPCLVLQASPGSGKTTRVPPALLERLPDGEILVLEPRRLAAKYAAGRVAEERGEAVGGTVGYQFRFENVGGPRTRLRFLTEGTLIRRLLANPGLEGVRAVILDEFHERHLHGDVALSYLAWLRATRRPDLKLIVMSATLDSKAVATFLAGCPTFSVEAAPHPVAIEYLARPSEKPFEHQVRDAVRNEITRADSDGGDILVFLPGMAEIRRAESVLEPLAASHSLRIHPLHGDLSRDAQDAAIRRGDRRKVILATNVAETSLTIEGVTIVIDSGLHRMASYSWWSGMPALRTRPISRASAIQRTGRAGRTAPGRCVRLYTRGEFDARPPFETPEIRRADLAQTVLELTALGIADPGTFSWFESPSPAALEASRGLLFRLGAIDAKGTLTSLGRRMVEFPAHPRVARLLLEAERRGVLEPTSRVAAFLSEGQLDSLDALELLGRSGNGRMDDGVRRTQAQWLSHFRGGKAKAAILDEATLEAVAFSLLTGFPDRVARRREDASAARLRAGQTELLFSSGGSAKVENAGVVREAETFIALDLQERQGHGQARAETRVHSLCPIATEWLFDLDPTGLREVEVLDWDTKSEAVMASSRLVYDELLLAETRRPAPPGPAATQILLKALWGREPEGLASLAPPDWVRLFGTLGAGKEIESALARGALFRKSSPGGSAAEPGALGPALLSLFEGKTSRREINEIDWSGAILQAVTGQPATSLDRLLPSHFTLPGGRRLEVHYVLNQPPWVESRLQDFFGMKQGPQLMNGRLPLTLHLLAPNGRAEQVTSDLAGFWERTYPALRKELGRKYPRHSWPEDPVHAEPPKPKPKRR